MKSIFKQALISELESKKEFDAMYDTDCNFCGNNIIESDPFIFIGNKEKMCNDCRYSLIEQLENI